MEEKYVFNDIDTLVTYLHSLQSNMSALQLQKSLYFLYALYVGMYYNSTQIAELGGEFYPDELFKADFEAWMYGPVIKEVLFKFQSNPNFYQDNLESPEYKTFISELTQKTYGKHVLKFVKDVFKDIVAKSDFMLVERSKKDPAWQKAFKAEDKTMSNELIIKQYLKIFRKS
ncbi:hypothetical protein CKF54_07445 [Psittacicella hinzii]|uniref:Antitoxin SocA-like Panacea domain-containing protein n=1 Tax=Psittacicella hinzii TaxID=2028575 RepID=A0A3A1Y117_9GAMM|nr:type II toxin-antitoxin system antitoxin SocA domain-containing protein [Psittacicella hinzii]RIY31151.1 hypothetical protein CKF54_07445 [Psittacicella hinzii]